MAKNEGKRFEEDIAASVPKDWFCYRLKDSSGSWSNDKSVSRFTPKNICDFFIFTGRKLYGVECKSFKGKAMPYGNLNDKKSGKLNQLCAMDEKPSCEGLFFLNFRDINKTYCIDAASVKLLKETSGRKSLSLKEVSQNGYIINQELKRVRWKYDLESVL